MENSNISIPSISSGGSSRDTDSSISSVSQMGGSSSLEGTVQPLKLQKNGLGSNEALAIGASGNMSNQTDAISALLISQCISKVNNMCKCFGLKGCNDSKFFGGGNAEKQDGGNLANLAVLNGLLNGNNPLGQNVAHGNPGGNNMLNQAILLNAMKDDGDDDDRDGLGDLAKLSLVQPGLLGNNVAHGVPGVQGNLGGSTNLLISIMNLNQGLSKLKKVVCDDKMTTFIEEIKKGNGNPINTQEIQELLNSHSNSKAGGKRRGRRPACKNSKKKSSCNRRKNCSWSKSHRRKGSKKRVSGSCRKTSRGRGRGRGRK